MKGLIEFFYIILLGAGILLILMLCNAIKQSFQNRKYTNVLTCIKGQGYKYVGRYNSKGKGVIYRKIISKEIIDSILLRYKLPPIEMESEFSITDYVAILEFPEWEERYTGITCSHGAVRLFHFYAMLMKIGDKIFERPLNHYLDDDLGGEKLAPIDLENREIIENMLSSSIREAIFKFNNEELAYWISKMSAR